MFIACRVICLACSNLQLLQSAVIATKGTQSFSLFFQDVGPESEKNFYASTSDSSSQSGEEQTAPPKKPFMMDPDHRLLLRTCKPLLNTRNAAVS